MYLFSFGGSKDKFSHPEVDWNKFINEVKNENSKLPLVWCPITKKMKPWIDTNKLARIYNKNCCIIL
jgi:hypothetical protein